MNKIIAILLAGMVFVLAGCNTTFNNTEPDTPTIYDEPGEGMDNTMH